MSLHTLNFNSKLLISRNSFILDFFEIIVVALRFIYFVFFYEFVS